MYTCHNYKYNAIIYQNLKSTAFYLNPSVVMCAYMSNYISRVYVHVIANPWIGIFVSNRRSNFTHYTLSSSNAACDVTIL